MQDFRRLGTAALAWTAHDALARADQSLFETVRSEIARRPPAEQEACRREWIRQASTADAALNRPVSRMWNGYWQRAARA